MADRLNRFPLGMVAYFSNHGAAGLAIRCIDSYFDQLMKFKCLLDFMEYRLIDAGLSGKHYRFKRVGKLAQLPDLFVV